MSDFDFRPSAIAADTTDVQAGTLSRIGAAITQGVPAAVGAGAISIANTLIDYAGGDLIDTEEAIRGVSSGAADYYKQNKEGVELAGFVIGAIAPGMLGVKGLKLLRAGLPAGNFSTALNLPQVAKLKHLKAGMQETAKAGNMLSIVSSSHRAKGFAWEVADQAMMGLAAETAIVGMMHDSPLFDGDSLGDFGFNMFLGTALSGGIGGVLGSITARGLLRGVAANVSKEQRLVDIVFDPAQLGLQKGTEVLALADSIVKLPDEFLNLPHTFKWEGATHKIELETADVFRNARARAEKLGYDKMAIRFTELLAGGDANVGQAYYDLIRRGLVAIRETGADTTRQIELITGYLNNVTRVSAVDLDTAAIDAAKFYPRAAGFSTAATPEEKLLGRFSKTAEPGYSRKAYRLAEGADVESIKTADFTDLSGLSIKDAFKRHPEVDVLTMPDGSVRINPYSKRVVKVGQNPWRIRQFVDLESGSVMPEADILFGDIIGAKGKKLIATQSGVQAGGKNFPQAASRGLSLDTPAIEASARFAWASQLAANDLKTVTRGGVRVDDLPVMDRLIELFADKQLSLLNLEKMSFKNAAGEAVEVKSLSDLRALVESQRSTWLRDRLQELGERAKVDDKVKVPSSHVFAAHLNTNRDWVEEAIGRGHLPVDPKAPGAGKVKLTTDALAPQTVHVEWDMTLGKATLSPQEAYRVNMGPSHLMTQELSMEYNRAIRAKVNLNAAITALGKYADRFEWADDLVSKGATQEGGGASLLTASSADYGNRAKLWTQSSGSNVAIVSKEAIDETIDSLAGYVNAMRDTPVANSDIGVLTNILRGSEHRYVFDTLTPGPNRRLISKQAFDQAKATGDSVDDVLASLQGTDRSPHSLKVKTQEVYDFLQAHTKINATRQSKFNLLYNASGLTSTRITDELIYVPPINTVKYPYHAFVRSKQKMGLATDVTMIVAKDEKQLRTLVAKVPDDFEVYFDKDTDNYFKARGEYEYTSSVHQAQVDATLKRAGILSDYFPETRFENVMEDWLNWHAKQEEKLVRNAVEVGNRQTFSELRFLSENYRVVSESLFRGIGDRFKRKVQDPFGDLIKTALNVSKQQEFPLLDSLNEFVDKLGYRMGAGLNAIRSDQVNGKKTMAEAAQEANDLMLSYGVRPVYDLNQLDTFITANQRPEINVIRDTIRKANLFLATAVLRLDFANSLVNMLSTTIMLGTELQSIKQLIGNNAEAAGKLRELTSVAIPGQPGAVMPSYGKLLHGAVSKWGTPEGRKLLERYQQIGAVKNIAQRYYEVMDDLAFDPKLSPSKWKDRVEKAVERGASITGNNFSEEFTRFVSADVMKQLSDPVVAAGKMTLKEQDAYISTFVNRVQGNYVTSQRPIVFQGTTGSAVSLFQTYAFNVLQQLFRHIENGHKKTLGVFAGLQTSVFGFNGLPFFDAINQHIIGGWVANNPEHKDAYSALPAFNKELGDWMLYGTASAFPFFSGSLPAVFTRGDINPRHWSVLPVTPMDVPAVQGSLRLIGAVTSFAKNLMPGSGMDATDALLKGLEHQGISRPLAGFAQVMAGRSTTSNGRLISAASEMQTTAWLSGLQERMLTFGGVSRLAGAKPMDEALALNALYRQKAFDAMDKARIERLGEVVKSRLYANEVPSDEEYEEFMIRYTRSGGRIENFNQAMQRWTKDANTSIINQMTQRVASPTSQRLSLLLGGEQLPDYTNLQE